MSSARPLKPWTLQKKGETLASFQNWKNVIYYYFTIDPNFAEFLDDDCIWQKKSEHPTRGFVNTSKGEGPNATDIIVNDTKKAKFLDIFLGMVAGFAPVLSPNIITRDACSMNEICQKLKAHYGFASTGSSILDVVNIHQQDDESVEDVFQRIHGLIDSCLLTKSDEMTHHDYTVDEDETLAPTLENVICCLSNPYTHVFLLLSNRDTPHF